MFTVDEVKRACNELIDDLDFKENRDSDKFLLTVCIKQGVCLKDTEFSPLREMFQERFGIQYDRLRGGWLLNVTDKLEYPPPEPVFTSAKNLLSTRTGLPPIDQKLEELEFEQEGFAIIPVSNLLTASVKVRLSIDDTYIDELAGTIKDKGVLQPLLVRRLPSGEYQIVAGEQRFRAAQKAGLKEIPCMVKQMSNREAYEVSLIENLQRKNLSDYEVAKALNHMMIHFPEEYPTQRVLAYKLGKKDKWISEYLSILELKEKIPAR